MCRKEALEPINMYVDPDDLLQNPQLPPCKYQGAEEPKTPVSKEEANAGEVWVCVCVCSSKETGGIVEHICMCICVSLLVMVTISKHCE